MNTQFNYATFVDMFLESDDDYEPYGVGISMAPPAGPVESEYDIPPLSPPS